MEDAQILDLYFARSEQAIKETDLKFGRYCLTIAYNILHNNEDSEECKNDTYIKAWNAIPPKKPENFRAYLGKIARNIALNMYEYMHRRGKGGGKHDNTRQHKRFSWHALSRQPQDIRKALLVRQPY